MKQKDEKAITDKAYNLMKPIIKKRLQDLWEWMKAVKEANKNPSKAKYK